MALPEPVLAVRELPYLLRLAAISALTLVACEWTRRVVAPLSLAKKPSSKSPNNHPRRRVAAAVASTLPLLAFFALAPLAFDPVAEVMSCAISMFVLLWLAAFKVVGLLLGRGPLAAKEWNAVQFAFVMALPVNPVLEPTSSSPPSSSPPSSSNSASSSSKLRRVPSRTRISEPLEGGATRRVAVCAAKVLLLAAVVSVLKVSREQPGKVPGWVLPYAYVFGLYAVLGMLMDGVGSLLAHCVGLELSPHFDTPFLARSYGDLWARRWNLVAGHSLRFLVFDVVAERRFVKQVGSKRTKRISLARRMVAVAACFVASGLVHELEMFYVLPGFSSYTGCWMLFFSGWGAILGLEKGLKIAAERVSGSRLWRKSKLPPLSLPRWLATPLVVASSVAYANLLFLPPAVDQGIAARVMASASWVLKALLRLDLE